MYQSHPAQVTPSWYGDSVGHYDGDTLVIDTLAVKIGPFSLVDWFGTPYTEALHVQLLGRRVLRLGADRFGRRAVSQQPRARVIAEEMGVAHIAAQRVHTPMAALVHHLEY
jgi:hypothetical protein